MSRDIQWIDEDPITGDKRFVMVEKFAREYRFKIRFRRRENWETPARVSRLMWETLLDGLERRYQRREGVSDEDLAYVRKKIAAMPKPEAAESDPPQADD